MILFFPLLVWWLVRKIKNKVVIFGLTGAVLFILGVSIYASLHQEIIEPYTTETKVNPNVWTASAEKRFYIWPVIWEIVNQRPFLGYGLENISLAYSQYFEINKHPFFEENLQPSSVLIRLKDLGVDRTHNFFLDILMSSGLLGFLTFGALIITLIKKAQSWTVLSSLLVYLIWSQFQNQSIVQLIYFWLLVGLIDRT